MSETMKAVRIHEYGGPEVLRYEDAPKPVASAGQVLVKIMAAGVNPADWKLREGYLKAFWHVPMPGILGVDIAGVVESVGDGVTEFVPGDAVYGGQTELGGYAQYVAISASNLARKPQSLSFVEAASVPVVALTAWQGLFETANLGTGETVLVHAAAGGVGIFAVQFAKAMGATVIGTASAMNESFVHSLGVDIFVDYKSTRFEEVVHDVDVVFDAVGTETATRSLRVLKPGGVLVCIAGGPDPDEAAKYPGVVVKAFVGRRNGEQLNEFTKRFDAGTLQTFVSETYPLNEARTAQESVAKGQTRGKIVLEIG